MILSRPLSIAALAFGLLGCSEASPETPPHVLLISLDTLRADRLGCYGYERPISPTIDALADRGILFERVVAPSNNTRTSHLTMLTGLLPPVHTPDDARDQALSSSIPTLAEHMKTAGYRTAAFADGGYMLAEFGFDRGFDTWFTTYERVDTKVDRTLAWLDEQDDRPTFLFFHTYGVHAPYLPAPACDVYTSEEYSGKLRERVSYLREAFGMESRGEARVEHRNPDRLQSYMENFWIGRGKFDDADTAYLSDLYDGCVQQVDQEVARLLDALDAKGWLEDTWIVITSDHGEAFREHGTYQHRQLYGEELWVPLIFVPPGGAAPVRRDEQVSLVDLTPTILELVGFRDPHPMQGVDLFGDDVDAARGAYAFGYESTIATALSPELKLIERPRSNQAFDLTQDPGETNNLFPEDGPPPAGVEPLQAALENIRVQSEELRELYGAGAVDDAQLTPEQQAMLRSLGYGG